MNIDEAIALLTNELDAQTVRELIAQFFADTPAQIAALREALGCGDVVTLGRTAHSIAGSSSTFGLQELRSAALVVEESAKAGRTDAVPGQIEVIQDAYDRAARELQRIIQQ